MVRLEGCSIKKQPFSELLRYKNGCSCWPECNYRVLSIEYIWFLSTSKRDASRNQRILPRPIKQSTGLFDTLTSFGPDFRIPLDDKNCGNSTSHSHNFGRSIGIRTRGLLDPKSPKIEFLIPPSTFGTIVSRIRGFPNYPVQLVHTVLKHSGSRFGSGKVAAPPKSKFSELLWLFHFGESCREYTIFFGICK